MMPKQLTTKATTANVRVSPATWLPISAEAGKTGVLAKSCFMALSNAVVSSGVPISRTNQVLLVTDLSWLQSKIPSGSTIKPGTTSDSFAPCSLLYTARIWSRNVGALMASPKVS